MPVEVVPRVNPVDGFSSLTADSGRAAPEESVTVPLKAPRKVWACGAAARITNRSD